MQRPKGRGVLEEQLMCQSGYGLVEWEWEERVSETGLQLVHMVLVFMLKEMESL